MVSPVTPPIHQRWTPVLPYPVTLKAICQVEIKTKTPF